MEGLLQAERNHDLKTEIVDLFPRRPPTGGFEPARKPMSTGFLRGFGLVSSISCCGLLGSRGRGSSRSFPSSPARVSSSSTTAVRRGPSLGALPNATALRLRAGQAAHLAGYLSGLMEARRTLLQRGRHVVSIISGEPNFPQQRALVQGFSTGVRRALPGVEIRSEYSFEYDDQATCERIANRQIDAAQASSSPRQAIARWARSRPLPSAECGASRPAKTSRTSARTFSPLRPTATTASSS